MKNTDINLSPDHQKFLDETFARNRATYAGYFMEDEGEGAESTDEGTEGAEETGEGSPGDGDLGSEDEGQEEQAEENSEEKSEDEGNKLSHDDALAALTKTRRSEAAMRTRLRDLEQKLEEAKTPEQVKEITDELVSTNAEEARALLVENVALTAGLPKGLAERLKGDTRAELEADAKALLKLVPSNVSPDDPDLQGGLDPDDGEAVFDEAAALALARKGRTRY